MTKHKGLTIDEHKELGLKLAKMRDELGAISVQLSHAYTLASGLNGLTERAQHYIDRLRIRLENYLYDEHGNELLRNGIDAHKFYYPSQEERQP